MAAVNFPNNPSVNDTHTSSGSTWKWDGTVWQRLGEAGPQGAQGVQGAQGHQGVQGAQGHQGRQGATGAQGSVGIASLTIATSPPSSPDSGDMWWDSDDGDLHLYYNDGNSSQWANINNGPAGAQGAQGAQGVQGAQGRQGAQGVQGAQGHQGVQGAQGHQGVQGATGATTTINNNADNRIITGSGTANRLEAEANLTYNGSKLDLTGDLAISTANRIYFGNSDVSFIKGEHGGSGYLALGANNEHMRLTRAGKVGIGTDNPYAPLALKTGPAASNTSNLADKGILLHAPGATDEQVIPISASFVTNAHLPRCAMGFISHPTADPIEGYAGEIAFYTHDAADGSAVNPTHERMRITRNGRIGIGKSTPSEKLDVNGTIQCLNELRSTTGNDLLLNAGSANRDVKIQVNDANIMYVKGSNSSVGIGVDAPDRKLHVKSGSNSNNGALRIESANSNIIDIGTDSSCHFINCVNNDPFRIKFAGNEAIRITQETTNNWTTTLQFQMETSAGQGATPYIKGVAGTEANGSASENAGGLEFHSKTGGSGTDVNAVRISHNGRVSIGAHNIQAPTAALHIIGDTSGSDVALQVGQDSAARYFRVNELSSQSNFSDVTLSFYDNTLAHILKLQNTYAALADMGTAIQFIGHGGGQTGRIAVKNRDVNTTSNSVMQLDASYVIKPSQPSFAAYQGQSSWGVASGATMVFNSTRHNVGNHYNTSNGRFTAPVAGSYLFTLFIIYTGNYNSAYIRMFKNGSRQYGSDVHFTHGDNSGNWDTVTMNQIFDLSEGDYITILNGNPGVTYHGNHWMQFCGYLLG